MLRLGYYCIALLGFVAVRTAYAGGSGLNTVVIVNQLSSNSCELGNYYCERRQVPPENVLRISWAGGNLDGTTNDFQTNLLAPLLSMLSSRQLTNQIDYVVVSMDIPIRTLFGSGNNSVTSTLFYGYKDDQGPDYLSVTNSYAASEQIFSNARPASAPGYSFLATMITAPTLALAKRLVDQGVSSDGTFPWQPVILAKSSDPARNIRYRFFDNAIFNTRLCGNYSVQRTNCDSLWGQTNILGFQTGLGLVSVSPNAFAPGAMADNLTSWGGVIFGFNDQTSLMSFITNGATGGYGSINETLAIPDKFPNLQVYFYQARGYSIAECYYQSVLEPWQGLTVAEPLAAPCARPGSIKWTAPSSDAAVAGVRQFSVKASGADATLPLHQIDLFIDGKYLRTLTNLSPSGGNVLTVALNGYPVSFTNPATASLAVTTSNLCQALNAPAVTNVTQVVGSQSGDRIELHSTYTNSTPPPFYFVVSASNSRRLYRVLSLPQSGLPALSSLGRRGDGAFRLHAEVPSATPMVILASTNLFDWLPIYTNTVGGLLDFVDPDSVSLPNRFYRLAGNPVDPRPRLSSTGLDNSHSLRIHIDAATSAPYTLDASPDLVNWISLATNIYGGAFDYVDAGAAILPCRFYRAAIVPPSPPPVPQVSFIGPAPGGGSLLRVDDATQPYVVQVATNLFSWTTLFTNLTPFAVKLSARTDPGTAPALTTFLKPARDAFLSSLANGSRQWTFNGSIQLGSWLQMTVTKTNGAKVVLSVTNQTFGANVSDIVAQLVNGVNASADLNGLDGITVQDVSPGAFSSTLVTFAARGAGLDASGTTITLGGTPAIYKNPSRESPLNANLSDLQPRNHLYAAAGASSLNHTFTLDTTALPDGFHELTAVAYEGTHVHTQTRATLPIRVQNTTLNATQTLVDLSPTNSVSGSYHIQVTANTNAIASIQLYSTGGLYASATNQSSVTFSIDASWLGPGLHSFYSIVTAMSGKQFRTQPQYARFVP
jgi:uncharacterized protein (TIGR03790 family)